MKIKHKKLLSKTYDLNTLSGKISNKINYEFQRTNKFIFWLKNNLSSYT